MDMTVFEIKGQYKEKGKDHKFTMQARAETEKYAIDQIMSRIGSTHKIKRRQIAIEEVNEAKE